MDSDTPPSKETNNKDPRNFLAPHVVSILQQNGMCDDNDASGSGPASCKNTIQRQKEAEENAIKNEMSLMRMFARLNERVKTTRKSVHYIEQEQRFEREAVKRTFSMVSAHGQIQLMTKTYKYITAIVLWFGYFSLALDDYIFGPTFDDLTIILGVDYTSIAYFAIIRQCAYTLGSLGGLCFNYVNRQLALVILMIISGGSLFVTPYSGSLNVFFIMGAINGFSSGACDVGFHVWILEMFQDGGGPLIQMLHFFFGLGMTVAPLISAPFLSGESECGTHEEEHHGNATLETSTVFSLLNTTTDKSESNQALIADTQRRLFIPYAITGSIVVGAGVLLLVLFFYKRYIPPKARKLPQSFEEQLPGQMTYREKLEVFRQSVPDFYGLTTITLGSFMLCFYYGLEVTFFQYLASFSSATILPIKGTDSAKLESATGGAYALGGLIATFVSIKMHPEHMIYLNFVLINVANVILWFGHKSELLLFIAGNIILGLGFSSTYATAYTFLEHQVNVTNLIGSIFLFAGGAGTAILPLFLKTLCQHPEFAIYMSMACANVAVLIFIIMHYMKYKRCKHIVFIKNQLLEQPVALWKGRTMSTISYEPQ